MANTIEICSDLPKPAYSVSPQLIIWPVVLLNSCVWLTDCEQGDFTNYLWSSGTVAYSVGALEAGHCRLIAFEMKLARLKTISNLCSSYRKF